MSERNCEIKIKIGGWGVAPKTRASIQINKWKHDNHKVDFWLSVIENASMLTINNLTIEDLKDLQNKIKEIIPVLEKEKLNVS